MVQAEISETHLFCRDRLIDTKPRSLINTGTPHFLPKCDSLCSVPLADASSMQLRSQHPVHEIQKSTQSTKTAKGRERITKEVSLFLHAKCKDSSMTCHHRAAVLFLPDTTEVHISQVF